VADPTLVGPITLPRPPHPTLYPEPAPENEFDDEEKTVVVGTLPSAKPARPAAPTSSALVNLPAPTIRPYVFALVLPASFDPESFHEQSSRRGVRERVLGVVQTEHPVHVDEVGRRVTSCWGIRRPTDRVKATLDEVVAELHAEGRLLRVGDFLWTAGSDPWAWNVIRSPARDGSVRDANLIPIEEWVAASRHALARARSMPTALLAAETARLFGIKGQNGDVEERVTRAVEVLRQAGLAKKGGRDSVEWESARRRG